MKKLDYNSYAEKCIDELKVLQNKFQKEFDLDSYKNWFYNQLTGLITFSTDKEEINFKYITVGSFSEKTNTWKWSWDNEKTHKKAREKASFIKEFGQKQKFLKLTNGYFPSDEFEAWEFTAITTKLLNGIGVYRPIYDLNLKIFLVLTEFVDSETAQNIKDKYVECNTHEFRRRAFVCQHLTNKTKIGFEEAFETHEEMELGEDDDLQAWCSKCEIERLKEDGWNDVSMAFAKIKLVCEKCYFEMKDQNYSKSQ
jgi:hypothetical protein